MIEMTLDFVSLHSYLALGPVRALAKECDVDLKLWPLSTPGETDTRRQSDESIGERHRRVRAEYTRREHQRYAQVQNLPLKITGYDQDSSVALQGLLAANEANVGAEFASRVMVAFWGGDLKIDSTDEINSILSEFGVKSFDTTNPKYDLNPVREALHERELFATPMLLVNGERYLGRQHLPMIRWQLTGKPAAPNLL